MPVGEEQGVIGRFRVCIELIVNGVYQMSMHAASMTWAPKGT